MILRGARQVGKTWLMRHFADEAYDNHLYVNFENNSSARKIFESDFDITRIKFTLETLTGQTIGKHTLIIFDEIQEAPHAVTALKYFYEQAPELHIMAAGSLLGIRNRPDESFPVGKVEFADIYPLSFVEFLMAAGEERLAETVLDARFDMLGIFSEKLTTLLRTYYFVGGMPEAVAAFFDGMNLKSARQVQADILASYYADFAKHVTPSEVVRVRMVWNSLIGQLAKENKKFIYGSLKPGARAKEFELAIQWLIDAGLVYKVARISKAELPLNAFEDLGAFKLFCLDIGLLGAMADIQAEAVMAGDRLFNQFKGALTEQYVLQQLKAGAIPVIAYWSAEKSTGELDFVIQAKGTIHPVEVKAETNLKAKSLRTFIEKNPGLHGIRFSMAPYERQSWVTNIPLYAVAGFCHSATLDV